MSTGKIKELALEQVMGDRFGRYSKSIILDRALPDIRDGLKPVQRRILFAMHQDGNTYDKEFRKSAKSVGNVMGNYHPHGDSSIYEALVRLSQNWKLRDPLIEMHGNNGSIDGDSPAAMRYTEARLSKIAEEMLRDIDKDTVDMVLNFDDSKHEPTVLPTHLPNLLVNGATGISAGYATSIPPHNLGEIIKGACHVLKHPEVTVAELMQIIPGPDFPTGGIVQGKEGLESAYSTGKGKVVLRSKTKMETLKGNREQIVVEEIPYEVNKALLVKQIDELRVTKKIEGISEVRDETDRTGLRVVIELKREVDANGILTYLFKNTDLQITYHFNMVAIDHQRPVHVSLKRALSAFLEHQRDVLVRKSRFDTQKYQQRLHIVEGLIKALSILDKIIALIRSSDTKMAAKNALCLKYHFSPEQAEAIVSLQLYRLTNTDVTALKEEERTLKGNLMRLADILAHETTQNQVILADLKELSQKYATPRRTQVEQHVEDLNVDTRLLVSDEQVMLLVSHDGYVKRSSMRSYLASDPDDNGLPDGDFPIYQGTAQTLDHVYIMTSKGNLIYRPVHELAEMKWKETSQHLSQDVGLDQDEYVVSVHLLSNLNEEGQFVWLTHDGYIKMTSLAHLQPTRTYRSRAITAIKLKSTDDFVVQVAYLLVKDLVSTDVYLFSRLGYGEHFKLAEVPETNAKTGGVKAIDLKNGDVVQSGVILNLDQQSHLEFVLVTQRGALKRFKGAELPLMQRNRRGLILLRELKRNPHRIIDCIPVTPSTTFNIRTVDQLIEFKAIDLPLNDRYSNGSFLVDPEQQGQILALLPNTKN